MRIVSIIAACALGLLAAGCADRTGNMTIADWCAQDASRANTDICKQHHDTESLGSRISDVLGLTHHAQETADQAMARNVQCVTRTLRRVQDGACDPGYTLTSCTQTHYGRSAGGLAIMRSINDTQCHYNQRVLEVQVRCCAMGPNLPPATMVTATEPPSPQTPPPRPVS
jgi:hypothetical protein